MLIEHGADIQLQDAFGATALDWSHVNTQLEILLTLVIPVHPYHVFMYDMLCQHTAARQAAATTFLCAAAAA